MKYKCVNELDKFMFQDAEVKKMEFNPGLMTMVLLGVAARHNNPSNDECCCEIAVDVEEDTYWVEVEFEKAVVEWEHFLNKVQA